MAGVGCVPAYAWAEVVTDAGGLIESNELLARWGEFGEIDALDSGFVFVEARGSAENGGENDDGCRRKQ